MGIEGIEHLQPDDAIAPGALVTEAKDLPLTLEDGTKIGVARVKEVEDGVEVEAIVDDEHKELVKLEGTAISLSSTQARVVSEQEVLDQETEELGKLFGLYNVLRAQREQKHKEKTQRRAKNKRARKTRRGNR